MELYRISAPHFYAGLEVDGKHVANTAPIVSYMRSWPLAQVISYCQSKHWHIAPVTPGKHKWD